MPVWLCPVMMPRGESWSRDGAAPPLVTGQSYQSHLVALAQVVQVATASRMDIQG